MKINSDIEQIILNREIIYIISDFLNTLNKDNKNIIELYINGCSLQEISLITNNKYSTVRYRVNKYIPELRDYIIDCTKGDLNGLY